MLRMPTVIDPVKQDIMELVMRQGGRGSSPCIRLCNAMKTFTVEYQDTVAGPTLDEPVDSGSNSGSPVAGVAPPHSPVSYNTCVTTDPILKR